MIGSHATLTELATALEAAGVGVYVYEGSRGAQKWLAGAANFANAPAPEDGHVAAISEEAPGISVRVGGAAGDAHLLRLPDGPDGRPRFIGVVRAADGAGAADLLSRRDGRSGVQAHLTHLSEILPEAALVVIAVFGIDGMREFSRAYGYDSGDALSEEVGRRIAGALPPDAAFAQIAASKFAAILINEEADAFRARAAELCQSLQEKPFDVGFGPVSVTISVGAAIARPETLISPDPFDAALAALDEATGEGDGALYLFDAHRDETPFSPKVMRAGARSVMRALEEDRIAIALQPVVSAAEPERLSFSECLARVLDDEGRWISAALFLPKIERLDLVRALDRRVLKLALDTLGRNETERLSVNVSVRTMRDKAWMKILRSAAEADPGRVERLIVELTESSAVVDAERTKAFLDDVRALGVAIALDDFGAGYSSFRYVRDFRPDWVKIDGSFVRGVAEDPDNKLFVDTLVGIARNFDMATVAEFVETDADADALRELGVDCLQGYRYGKPVIAPNWREIAEASSDRRA